MLRRKYRWLKGDAAHKRMLALIPAVEERRKNPAGYPEGVPEQDKMKLPIQIRA